MKEILDVIHKTIYQFFDVCGDDEEVPLSDKDKLLLQVNKAICNNLKALEQEPCEDAISRKDVEECKELMTDINGDTVYAMRMSDIRQLSPVNPHLEHGEWISEKVDGEDWKGCKRQYYQPISCSKCHSPNHYKSTYCPNCGAKMESEDKE